MMEVDSINTENVAAESSVAAATTEEAQAPVVEPEAQEPEKSSTSDDAGEKATMNGDPMDDAPAEPAEQPPEPAEETIDAPKESSPAEVVKCGQKRRASHSLTLSDTEEFRGFTADESKLDDSAVLYSSLVDSMAAEVAAEEAALTPLRRVAAPRSIKRLRTEDRSRSSSSLSHRSDAENLSSDMGASSPASGRGRRVAPDTLSSPQYRVPLERGWKRELVYRAALDVHSRRNADIYYYTPAGKKLRSTREVADHISGTGLTLANFSFFKEPIGVDDPDKEIIRDAKQRDSPQASPVQPPVPVEGKRTPKPKAPKGASPEHRSAVTPLKLKVKSQGSRLSGNRTSAAADKPAPPTNAAWKKPRLPVPPPPPLLSRPELPRQRADSQGEPCSMRCPGAPGQVPCLACSVCLCLYHPVCAGHTGATANFLCKNCRVNSGPPPLTHKSGALTPPPLTAAPGLRQSVPVLRQSVPVLRQSVPVLRQSRAIVRPVYPLPRTGGPSRLPAPQRAHKVGILKKQPVEREPVARCPVPIAARVVAPAQKMEVAQAAPRVLLRMKARGGGEDRVWAVQPPAPSVQTITIIEGRKYIVVPKRTTYTMHAPGTANGDAGKRRARAAAADHFTPFCRRSEECNFDMVSQIFQYLGMRDLARCARVCRLWREMAARASLWRHVRMKNSQVNDWKGLCAALSRRGTQRLDLRKMLLPPNDDNFWTQFAKHIGTVTSLERLELCRCPARAVEAACAGLRDLRQLGALAVRDNHLDPAPLGRLERLTELRIKSMAGLTLKSDLTPLANLKHLQHLSLTSIKELGNAQCGLVVGKLTGLVSLELGECTFGAEFGAALGRLAALQRLRLERGTADCDAPALLRALAGLPQLRQLELVNFDVKPGFDEALGQCRNIQRLLIIPTYVSQSATTNRQVLGGILRLKETLTHLMWGVTIELLRVTELFIDQCEGGAKRSKLDGQSIPVLKPVPGYTTVGDQQNGPAQVEILPLPTLQNLLSTSLPSTKLKLLKIPFHATWRQSLADFQ